MRGLAADLAALGKYVELLGAKTGQQFDQVQEAILSLMATDGRKQ